MTKTGAAMPAAVNRMTATSSPATPKTISERQYLARLMRPVALNRNSNRYSMIPSADVARGQAQPVCRDKTKQGSFSDRHGCPPIHRARLARSGAKDKGPRASLCSTIPSSQILHMPPILGSAIGVEIAVLRNFPL
jgi:hypothetical protein